MICLPSLCSSLFAADIVYVAIITREGREKWLFSSLASYQNGENILCVAVVGKKTRKKVEGKKEKRVFAAAVGIFISNI